MTLFALNAAAIIGISMILMKLNFPLMEQAITILIAIVKIAEMIGGNAMNLSMSLQRSGIDELAKSTRN